MFQRAPKGSSDIIFTCTLKKTPSLSTKCLLSPIIQLLLYYEIRKKSNKETNFISPLEHILKNTEKCNCF